VSVLRNDPLHPFATETRFRAGTGLYVLDRLNDNLVVSSRDRTLALAAVPFTAGTGTALAVLNSGSNSFTLLSGDAAGGLFNPQGSAGFTTGRRPLALVAGRFTPGPNLDLAVLDQGSGDLAIFRGDGNGGFTRTLTLAAGNRPTGLTLADCNGDGNLDLLVGNEFGDVLVLLGNGDGTFQPYQRVSTHLARAVTDLNHDGRNDFIFANQSQDQVTVRYAQAGPDFEQGRTDGVLAPGAVQATDLNGDGLPDLTVANSGSNEVFVYLGLGNGQFGPARKFFTGTNPAGVTVADLNGDG